MGSGGQYRYDALADDASGHFTPGGAGRFAAAVEQFYQPGKDTSLAATIRCRSCFVRAQLITSRTLEVFTMYLAASLIYWVMATVLSSLQNYFENQLNRQERDPK